MKRLLHLLFVIAFVTVGLIFGSLNEAPVPVDYFFFQVEWPLALSLGAFFFGGALFGGLLTWLGSWLTMRRRLRQARLAAATPDASTALTVAEDKPEPPAPAAASRT